MKQNKITIDRNSVKELNRTQLENVLFAVYNDNIALKKKVDEMGAIIAELREFRNLANAEKYTPSSEAIQGLFPELEVMIQYSDPVEDEKPADGGDVKVENVRDQRFQLFWLKLVVGNTGINPEEYVEFVLRFGPNTDKKDYDSLMPWNAYLKKLDAYRNALKNAKPDPDRKEPCVLCGFSR